MNARFDFGNSDTDRLVYIRPVNVADLPEDMQAQVEGQDRIYDKLGGEMTRK